MSDFYLTAPSNASFDTFPDNKMGAFKIRLPQAINLADYEVALTEIQYPMTWYNVEDADFIVSFPHGGRHETGLSDGRYENVESIVDAMNAKLKKLNVHQAIKVSYDANRMKTVIEIRDHVALIMSRKLRSLLGFSEGLFHKGTSISENYADADSGMTAIYVYSDIARNQIVGDTMTPLLRVVPIRNRRAEVYRTQEFLHPRYLPTKKETTSVFEFNLRRDDGSIISFKTGKVVLTLHFRALRK